MHQTNEAERDAIHAAFAAHPRTGFLRPAERAMASHDGPLPIGCDQTSSQPYTVDAMLRLLDVRAGMRVLDVGAGSGWTTALLAHLVGPAGEVRGVELEPDLVRFGSANLAATNQDWASIVPAEPGVLGLPGAAPFDRILVSAEADELPQALVEQMADGGLMVIPVAGVMLRVRRRADRIKRSKHGYFSFVPLRQG